MIDVSRIAQNTGKSIVSVQNEMQNELLKGYIALATEKFIENQSSCSLVVDCWSPIEEVRLKEGIGMYGHQWKKVSAHIQSKDEV